MNWGSLGDHLAGLGDAISASASSHARQQREQQNTASSAGGGDGVIGEATTTIVGGTMVRLPPPAPAVASSPTTAAATTDNNDPNATSIILDDNSHDNLDAEEFIRERARRIVDAVEKKTEERDCHRQQQHQQQQQLQQTTNALLGSLRGWTTKIAESTKEIVNEAQRAVEKEQARIRETAPSLFGHRGNDDDDDGYYYTRDVNLALDVESLRDAEVVYITDRIISMGHPALQSTTNGDITPRRKLAAIGHMLRKRHDGKFMMWNISEVDYNFAILDDQVLSYKFPGCPSPPLGLLLKLLMAMESWLKADARNVVVVHCLTGRGRTSTVLASLLCWTGEAGFNDVNGALEYIAKCKRLNVNSLTIPSQIRYMGYFANMLDGVRPSRPPLVLKRIIMSQAPKFGKRQNNNAAGGGGVEGKGGEEDMDQQQLQQVWGCAPYLQLFKGGNLIFTTAASMNYSQSVDELPFCTISDGPVSFLVDATIQGDVFLRCRHLTKSGQRVSMFRAAFHTGYVPPRVLRLTKVQLDGACADHRFDDGFFLDLIFEACDEATAAAGVVEAAVPDGKIGMVNNNNNSKDNNDDASSENKVETSTTTTVGEAANEAAQRRSMGTTTTTTTTTTSGANVIMASAYDSMLHSDSRFWDVIADRREENMRRREAILKSSGEGEEGVGKVEEGEQTNVIADVAPLSGPTIGRRRDFVTKGMSGGGGDGLADDKMGDGGGGGSGGGTKGKTREDKMNAFSIGEDFFGLPTTPTSAGTANAIGSIKVPLTPPQPKEKDALMEALDDIDEDGWDDDDGEVIFNDLGPTTNAIDVPSLSAAPVADLSTVTIDVSTPTKGGAMETDMKLLDTPSDVNTPNLILETSTTPVVTDIPTDTGLVDDMVDLDVEDTNIDGFGDDEDLDFDDDDDADIADLESFLSKSLK